MVDISLAENVLISLKGQSLCGCDNWHIIRWVSAPSMFSFINTASKLFTVRNGYTNPTVNTIHFHQPNTSDVLPIWVTL